MCIRDRYTIVAHNIAQNGPDNFASYPPDNHHCSDDVYLIEGGAYPGHRCKGYACTDNMTSYTSWPSESI